MSVTTPSVPDDAPADEQPAPGTAAERAVQAAAARIRRVDAAAAALLHTRGALFVDTRSEAQRRRTGTIPGAIEIHRNVLEWRLDPASPHRHPAVRAGEPVVVFCQQGYGSVLAVAALADLGLDDVVELRGGIEAWMAAGLPLEGAPPADLDVEALTGSIGAVVHGVDLVHGLSDAQVAGVRAALARHRVVFLRDQRVTPDALVAFARRFGEPTPAHPLLGGLDDAHPEILVLDSADYPLGVGSTRGGTSYDDRWHTDVTFSPAPPMGSILAAVQLPSTGGDTLWADLVGAHASLSEPVRTLIAGLHAVHDTGATFQRFRTEDADGERSARLAALEPVEHPVVRRHPETGELGLFVNPTFTRRIVELGEAESRAVLDLLCTHLTQPEHTVRWRWRPGDVAFWDNRATAHYATADYTGRRVMHRVTLAGERPVGP